MADWFAKLMHGRHVHSSRAIPRPASSPLARARPDAATRDARYDTLVRLLRERETEGREAREKRQRWYRQSLESDAGASGEASAESPIRLHRLRTKVPCSATMEARAMLAQLREWFPDGVVTFPRTADGRQAVMLTEADGGEPRQIGWVEQCVQSDPTLCNIRHQGLTVETDDDAMLVLRFRYPRTAVRISTRSESTATSVSFAEIRCALDLRPSDRGATPRLVWVSRPELETMSALRSRDYEAFYVRFKLEVQSGIWSSLSSLLATLPASRWHEGSCYTVVHEPDAACRRIHQRTIDDSGRTVDVGADRIYDAAPATDILLLYLEGDILADCADIYFTLQSLDSADAYFLKEEFFTVIRRFWAGAQSLASRYGSDVAAVLRMCRHTLPMPAQAPMLAQDWTNLRQSLVDRYGEGGRKVHRLAADEVHRPRVGPQGWPFESVPAGDVNLGLRVVYRQEWHHLGVARGEVIRTHPPVLAEHEKESTAMPRTRRRVETTIERGEVATNLDELVNDALGATLGAMKWSRDHEGNAGIGIRPLAASTSMGLESECRVSSDDACTRLGDIMRRMANETRQVAAVAVSVPADEEPDSSTSADAASAEQDAATRVYSRLQNSYEVLTRAVEIESVVMIAEKLPTPAEVDLAWVRRHAWILAKVLLDESFRDALVTIGQEGRTPQRALELATKRDALHEHLRANVLHYQRAIWRQEDPQQRRMRYRRSGRKVPLDWRFELESGSALTIEELATRLTATQVDGQFAAYSGGREMDLDQVIDLAGPIEYYGNYAIHRMRADLGDAELFSMLHFFKSPYLRANEETRQPEVDDPLRIQIAEDPGVAAASDEVIEQHREGMFRYVPELRDELARSRENGSDGTNPGATEMSTHSPESLRRHFATYLFRRERARRVAIDADGVVIDVFRAVDPVPETIEHPERAIDAGDGVEAHALVVASGFDSMGLSANGHRVANPEWAILADDVRRGSSLIVASRAPDAREPSILGRCDGVLQLASAAVATAMQPREPAILAPGDVGGAPPLISGARARRAEDPLILAPRAGAPAPRARVGFAHDPPNEGVIVAPNAAMTVFTAVASRAPAASRVEDPVIVPPGDTTRTTPLRAGVRDSVGERHERMIVTREDATLRLTPMVGTGTIQVHERRILARDNDRLRPSLFAR